ncbi:hypothetical protein FACS1894166_01530 [Bacilli bacterium]|nr:hypothetical protein FACS1894166_01530 [Bacilli bacterium]
MVKYDKNTDGHVGGPKRLNKVRQMLMKIKIRYVMLIFIVASFLIVGSSICISLSTE